MRQFFCKKYAYCMAAMLAGVVSFSSCSNDDELIDNGPAQSGEVVKTQFTINIPAGKASTRLAEDIVQGQTPVKFRGMDNIHMFAFDLDASNDTANALATTDAAVQVYDDMGSILSNELINANAKVYYDIEISTGVNRLLFYGEATQAEGATPADNGCLVPTYLDDTSDKVSAIQFALDQIVENDSDGQNSTVLQAVNSVAAVSGWSTTTNAILKDYYTRFTTLKAGSANSVRQALTYLQTGVTAVDTDSDATAATLKTNILSAISSALTSLNSVDFPRSAGLPDGAVQLAWNSDGSKFEWAATSKNIWGSQAAAPAVTNYVHPAALYYWTSSPISVSNTTESPNYSKYNAWSALVVGLYTDGHVVTENTRSIALINEINYGVARLDVKAHFSASVEGKVPDNVSEDVDVVDEGGKGMELVGLLVGGQKAVQFDFTPKSDADEYSIYDRSGIPATTATLGTSTPSSVMAQTLVLETADTEGNGDGKVRFALELQNNTENSFTGIDGEVPAGGRFYLVGELEPSTAEQYANMGGKVFKQDFVTTANVTITSLAHAYNCIPDLREPQLELGLSVNLEWQAGLVDDVTID